MDYKSYCKDMKKFKSPPMSEKDFNEMQGIETEVELPVFIARKSGSHKQVKPTLEAHTNQKAT